MENKPLWTIKYFGYKRTEIPEACRDLLISLKVSVLNLANVTNVCYRSKVTRMWLGGIKLEMLSWRNASYCLSRRPKSAPELAHQALSILGQSHYSHLDGRQREKRLSSLFEGTQKLYPMPPYMWDMTF